nr:hypothetical protein [Tanacetum cinerariifolium]GEZ23406.1 hypothetical protein [Tanacetum cinerariifolium]
QYTVNYPIFDAHHDLLGSQKKREEKQIEEEQAAKAQSWKFPVCYDDDDDEEGYNSLNDNIIPELPPYSAVMPTELIDSLSMGDEHLNTISATESDEFVKSSVVNLVPNPSESEDENGCDVLAGFTTFSNIDSLFDEFTGELTLLKSIPPGIDETDCHPEEEIHLTKRLLYDNSSPLSVGNLDEDLSISSSLHNLIEDDSNGSSAGTSLPKGGETVTTVNFQNFK